jgi:ribonuclease HIII
MRYLKEYDWEFREVPYARFAAEKKDVKAVFYESGKLVVQGKGDGRVRGVRVLEPEVLKEARVGLRGGVESGFVGAEVGRG